MTKVKKAVIPAAGYGSRMLPASKAVPKELFPVAGKPVIQHIIEEAVSAGIEEILIIISKGKEAIKSHFSPDTDLEARLLKDSKLDALNEVKQLSNLAQIEFIYQPEQKGLGDAVLLAKEWVNDDPFMIMLGDTIINPTSQTQELISTFKKTNDNIVLVRRIPREDVSRYGILDGSSIDNQSIMQVKNWIEKPSLQDAPSDLAIAGRYIFHSDIFKYLEKTERGVNNEIQLTDAMRDMLSDHQCLAKVLQGKRYDIGKWSEFLKANIELFNL